MDNRNQIAGTKNNRLPKFLTREIRFFRIFAIALFIALPFLGFYLGLIYQKALDRQTINNIYENKKTVNANNTFGKSIEIKKGKIILDFYPKDYKILKNPQNWLNELNDAYTAYKDLVGGVVPFNEAPITIKETPESEMGGAELLSGNPITWDDRYLPWKMYAINNYNDLSFGPIHELGHDFDMYFNTRYYLQGNADILNPEQWANFKLTYVADTLSKKYPNATFYQPQVGFLPIGEFSKLYFYDIFAKEWLSSKSADWRDMKHDAYTGLLYSLTQKYGWGPFKKTFSEYNTFNLILNPPPLDDLGKIQLFADTLSKYAGKGVITEFNSWGIPVK